MKSVSRSKLLLFSFCIFLSGCHSGPRNSGPVIEFIRVPPASNDGSDKLDIIEGRVVGARAGQQLVLYAKNSTWWVQPLVNEQFTAIRPNSTWTNTTHVGTEYAALLVEPGYRPQTTMETLPKPEGSVVAVATATGGSSGASVTKTLSFGGYEWRIRNAPSDRGGMNNYDPKNAWTDSDGALHLRIAGAPGKWTCAEVSLMRSFGYGTYSFVVRSTSQLEPAGVFSIFTWDYAGSDQNHREMAIEVSQWGDPTAKNSQFVVQPYYVPANEIRFSAPPGVLTYSFHWEPGRVSFRTVPGSEVESKARPVAEHIFTSGVPSHGIESVRMNLYVLQSAKDPLQKGAEVVIERFEYLP